MVVLANSFGNVALGYGMRSIETGSSYSPEDVLAAVAGGLPSPWTILGIALLALFFAAHTLLLSWADLSWVLLVTSVGYVLTAALGAFLLDEPVTPLRWVGVLLISCGVVVAGSTPVSTVR